MVVRCIASTNGKQSVGTGDHGNKDRSFYPFVERLIGTIRREYLFWTMVDVEKEAARIPTLL